MGLFGKTTQADYGNSLDDFIKTHSADKIFEMAKWILKPDWEWNGYNYQFYVRTKDELRWIGFLDFKVPKCYKKNVVTADYLLQIASEKGSCNASILLGTMYEFGFIVEENRMKAKEYYSLAATQGSKLGDLLYDLVNEYYHFTKYMNDKESLVMNMWIATFKENPPNQLQIRFQEASEEDLEFLSWITFILMWAFASWEYNSFMYVFLVSLGCEFMTGDEKKYSIYAKNICDENIKSLFVKSNGTVNSSYKGVLDDLNENIRKGNAKCVSAIERYTCFRQGI